MASIKIATGIKTYDVEDQFGNVRGQIKFNPADVNFIGRLVNLEKNANTYLSERDKLNDELSSLADDESKDAMDKAQGIIAALHYYDSQIKQLLNDTFQDENLSNVVFGNESSFNLLDGETYIERFFKAVLPIIKADVEEATKNLDNRLDKYLSNVHEK